MNESETNPPAADDLADQIVFLRRQITLLLLALIVLSGTVTVYLFYQSRTMGNDLAAIEPQAQEIVQNYNKNLPNIQKFVETMVAYGQAHPDFQPILKKCGIPVTLPAATNSAPKP